MNGSCEPIDDCARLRREVGGRYPGRVVWRPGEAPVILSLRVRAAEVAQRIGLGGNEVLHLVSRDHGPAEPGAPLPGGVRERAVRALQVGACRRDRVRPDARQHDLMLEEVVQVVAPRRKRRARDSVVTEVAVELLRPVAHVGAHVGPEGAVLQPALQVCLVRRQVERALSHPDDEHGSFRLGQRPVSVEQSADEVARVDARGPVTAPHRGGELVHRPGVTERHVVAGHSHPPPSLDTRLVPRRAVVRYPGAPGRHADLGHRMEVRAEGPNPPRLVRAQLRVIGGKRRNRKVVLRTRRRIRCQLRR